MHRWLLILAILLSSVFLLTFKQYNICGVFSTGRTSTASAESSAATSVPEHSSPAAETRTRSTTSTASAAIEFTASVATHSSSAIETRTRTPSAAFDANSCRHSSAGAGAFVSQIIGPGCSMKPIAFDSEVHLPSDGVATFVVDPQAAGRPPPNATTWDQWRVDASGELPSGLIVRASPPLHPLPMAGFYTFTLALPNAPRGGNVTLSVYLQQSDFFLPTRLSPTCNSAPKAGSRTTFRARVVLPSGIGDRGALPACGRSFGDAFLGWYIANTSSPTFFQWEAARCRFEYFSSEDVRSCLSDVWLAFVGDSTMEELAIATTLLIGGSFNDSWSTVTCRNATDPRHSRQFDTRDSLASGARVSMTWAAGESPCHDYTGAKTFSSTAYLTRFSHALTGDARAPRIVANTLLHDIIYLDRASVLGVRDYASSLANWMFPALSNVSHAYPLTWKTGNPKGCFRSGAESSLGYHGDALVGAMNDVALHIVAAQPKGTMAPRILDEHALLLPFAFDNGQLQRHHCSSVMRAGFPGRNPDGTPSGLNGISGDRTLGGVYSGCLATVHALLNSICSISH